MKKRLTRTAAAVAALVLLFSSLTTVRALDLSAEHAILMDAGSGRVLYEKMRTPGVSLPVPQKS